MTYKLFNGIAAASVNQYLSDNGFAVKGNKASVYVGQGLMLSGKRQVLPGRNGNYPLFYSAVAAVEFMTATILKKGDWLTLNSSIKNSKFTTQDVFYGRLGFYLDILSSGTVKGAFQKLKAELVPMDIRSDMPFNFFQTNISDFIPHVRNSDKNKTPEYLIMMDPESISTVLSIGKNLLLSQYQSDETVQTYLSWSKSIYSLNFCSVYFSHINKLAAISTSGIRTKFDPDDMDNSFFYLVKDVLIEKSQN